MNKAMRDLLAEITQRDLVKTLETLGHPATDASFRWIDRNVAFVPQGMRAVIAMAYRAGFSSGIRKRNKEDKMGARNGSSQG